MLQSHILKKKGAEVSTAHEALLPRLKEMALAKVSPVVRTEIKMLLEVPNETLSEKYLGMPSDVGNSFFENK